MRLYIRVHQGKKKVVQTELEPDDYANLLSIAKSRNLTIKQATREALRWWSASVADLSEDPLFKMSPVDFKLKVRADEIEASLYGRK